MDLGGNISTKNVFLPPKEITTAISIEITLNMYIILKEKKGFIFTIQFFHLGTSVNQHSVQVSSAASCSFLCVGPDDQRMVGSKKALKRLRGRTKVPGLTLLRAVCHLTVYSVVLTSFSAGPNGM